MSLDLFVLSNKLQTTGNKEAVDALRQVDAAGKQTAASLNGVESTLGAVQREMVRGAASAVGLGTTLGRVATSLSSMAAGGWVAVGFIAGAALIKGGYDLLTQGANEAKEAADELIKSLDREIEAAHRASVAGKQESLQAAEARRDALKERIAALQKTVSGGEAPMTVDPRAPVGVFIGAAIAARSQKAAQKELAQALKEVRQAELDVAEAKSRDVKETYRLAAASDAAMEAALKPDKVKKEKKPKAEHDQEAQAQAMLRQIRDQAFEDKLRAEGRDDQADFARIDREFDRRKDEIERLKVSEQTKTDLLLAAAEARGAAELALDEKIWDRIRKAREDQAKKEKAEAERAAEARKRLEQQLASEIADVIIGSVEDAFEGIASGKGLVDGFKRLAGGILRGFGGIMVQIGKQVIAGSVLIAKAVAALLTLNPWVALAAGIALVALGSAIGGSGGGGGGTFSGGASTSSAATRNEEITRFKFINRDGSMVNGLTPLAPMNFVVIGENDPVAQRTISNIVYKASRRNG